MIGIWQILILAVLVYGLIKFGQWIMKIIRYINRHLDD